MDITDIKGTVKLANGYAMPYFGLGVFQMKDGDEVINAVNCALEAGYRHIDTASMYFNETGVGKAIRDSNISREDIFVTTKLGNPEQGYENTLEAFEKSMERLGLEYLDLYLIHWPVSGKYKDTWKAFEKLYKERRIKSIGVSNFLQHHLEDIMDESEITPMVNQMEFHPHLLQQGLLNFCNQHKIQYEAWSPLMQGKIFEEKEFQQLAQKYNKNAAQLVLRWNLQKEVVTIPKSSKSERIISNADIFDFEISKEDMQKIDFMDKNERLGPDPDNFDF